MTLQKARVPRSPEPSRPLLWDDKAGRSRASVGAESKPPEGPRLLSKRLDGQRTRTPERESSSADGCPAPFCCSLENGKYIYTRSPKTER